MISNCQQKPTIQTPQRPKQTNQRQLNTCLLNSIKGKLSSTLANKKQQQQSSLVNNCNKISTMSTLTQDMRTAVVPATTVNSPNSNVKPPLEAVVVNSIIYAKPSFCTIAVDLGDLTGSKKQQTQSLCPKDIFDSETFCSTSDMSLAASCLAGLIANTSASSSSSSSLHMGSDDAKVYRMCTTINGSIHHQISELCDNILAMAEMFKNHTNNKQDDDSFIEFNYGDDDEDDDYLYHQHKNDEEDDEDEDEDDDDDEEDILDDQVYYDDDLDDDDNDVVDFSYECPIEPAPKLNCDKKKKVRFNTKPTVHVMHTWSYAYRAARKGEWEMYARDRERFKLRIQRVALTLNPILDREHRQKIYEKRFVNLYDNDDNNDNNNNVGPLTSETCQDNHNVTMANELVKETKELKNASDNANNTNNTNNNSESKKPHQKKKRKKRRFVKMGNKHYF